MNNNPESILDNRIKLSLYKKTTDNFTDNIMKRIELQMKFKKEDSLITNFARNITIALIAFISIIVGIVFVSTSSETSSADERYSDLIIRFFHNAGEVLINIFTYIGSVINTGSLLYVAVLIAIVITVFLLESILSVIKQKK